jgi:hypothetical protein
MQRFLKDSDDRLLLHWERPSQDRSRSDHLRAVINGVDQLELLKQDVKASRTGEIKNFLR